MKLLFLVVFCATSLSALCSCGSNSSSSGGSDASVDVSGLDGGSAVLASKCDNTGLLLTGCVAGACTVSATGKPLPTGALITVTQKPAPLDLNGDTLGPILCSIDLPTGVSTLADLRLSIALATAPHANSVLFNYVSPLLSHIVATSEPSGNAVVGLVTAPGDFGATEQPAPWSLQANLGLDISSSDEQASWLRNLASQPIYDAFYDGTHLFVCNGRRLLGYSGLPAGPATKPDLVLGQPDLDTLDERTSSSLFGLGACDTVWSDSHRLAVANQNRVLIWNQMPSASLTPADIVLGQPDFTSNIANNGGVRATSLQSPQNIDSNGTQFAVADMLNNRLLIWKAFPSVVDQAADFVVGQPDFSTNAIGAGAIGNYELFGIAFDSSGLLMTSLLGGSGLAHIPIVTANNPPANFVALPSGTALVPTTINPSPARIAKTPNGGLAIRNYGNQRVAILRKLPTGPTSVDFVLGQPDPMHVVESLVSASVVSAPYPGGASDLGGGAAVLVPDRYRLLIFETPPTFNFEPASRVVGQAGFTTNGNIDYRGISASTLAGPADVSVAGGRVAVADRDNNRVLLFQASDIAAHNLAATVVLGQPDGQSYIPNLDQRTPSAARMSGPSGVALDGTHLIVADTENHRVLIWNSVPSMTATPADLVLGQTDFSARKPNRGRGDQNADGYSDAGADGFFYPMGVASDGTHLFVADRLNNRILVWKTFPTSSGQAADAVIGQADFTSSQPNRNNGPFKFVADGLNLPTGVTLAGTSLWVADTENNRLVRWDNAATAPNPAAFVGQPSGATVTNPNYVLDTQPSAAGQANPTQPTTAASVFRPRAVAVVGATLYVTESDSNRVHMLDATTFASLGALGQGGETAGGANTNGIGASSLATPLGIASDGSTIWVADSANNRILGYGVTAPPSTGAAATFVLGQPSFLTAGFDQASTASNGTTSQPRGLALSNGSLYVADTNNSRVLMMKTPITAGQQPARIYGQPNGTLALPNAGGAPSASTLAGPQGVFADSAHVIVADTANNRVLVYDAAAAGGAATLVLGQATFATNVPNGGGPSAGSMQNPAAAYSDGTSLWVADTGNHRVLAWNAFPTSNGQPADVVIGQTSFSGFLPNQGNAAASASSLSFPTGIIVVNHVLYIADTGNNRVLSYSTMPTAPAANADGVLGQRDLVGRTAALVSDDLIHLAGPIHLAEDGENLYVVDRDLGRVVAYGIGTLKSRQPAAFSIGIVGGLPFAGPAGIAAERTPFFTSRLYIGNTGHNEVTIVQSVSRLALP
jgi:hypothetical protein